MCCDFTMYLNVILIIKLSNYCYINVHNFLAVYYLFIVTILCVLLIYAVTSLCVSFQNCDITFCIMFKIPLWNHSVLCLCTMERPNEGQNNQNLFMFLTCCWMWPWGNGIPFQVCYRVLWLLVTPQSFVYLICLVMLSSCLNASDIAYTHG